MIRLQRLSDVKKTKTDLYCPSCSYGLKLVSALNPYYALYRCENCGCEVDVDRKTRLKDKICLRVEVD
jgi:transposase-like protein